MPSDSPASVVPVILSGGVGSRLWPLSRALYPKQLQPLASDLSLLQEAAVRVSGENFTAPIIVCNEDHRFIVGEQLSQSSITSQAILLEPAGRNTAPAVAAAAAWASRNGDDPILLVMASDHVIRDEAAFLAAVLSGRDAAAAGYLTAIGITAREPETAYGYIKAGGEISGIDGCYQIERFVEKPDRPTAEGYVASGDYLWNASLFMFTASAYLTELERVQPEMVRLCRESIDKSTADLDFIRLEQSSFTAVTSISIDYAVMENAGKAAVVPANLGWNDVGSWDALWEISDKDSNGNTLIGDIVTDGVTGSYIRSESQLVAVTGIKDAIIVSTDDAVLVAAKDEAQNVKDLVEALKKNKRAEHLSHTKVYRPWGWYQSLETGDRFQVKLIQLSPQAKISLQRHQHRAEHWVVVSGTATVTKGSEVIELAENESTYIPVGEKHRLENKQSEPLLIIEVQSGSYLGEDDIERFDDQYGRD